VPNSASAAVQAARSHRGHSRRRPDGEWPSSPRRHRTVPRPLRHTHSRHDIRPCKEHEARVNQGIPLSAPQSRSQFTPPTSQRLDARERRDDPDCALYTQPLARSDGSTRRTSTSRLPGSPPGCLSALFDASGQQQSAGTRTASNRQAQALTAMPPAADKTRLLGPAESARPPLGQNAQPGDGAQPIHALLPAGVTDRRSLTPTQVSQIKSAFAASKCPTHRRPDSFRGDEDDPYPSQDRATREPREPREHRGSLPTAAIRGELSATRRAVNA
jgi:hypothetical protein